MKRIFISFLLVAVLIFSSCNDPSAVTKTVNAMTLSDSNPPVLLEVISESDCSVRLVFNETVFPFAETFSPYNAIEEENSILITLPSSLSPGENRSLSGRVADQVGNTAQVSVNVWGYNSRIPKLLINEVSTKGTENNPDRVELSVLSDGNLAGITVYAGVPQDSDSYIVLPSREVNAGDFITVSWSSGSKIIPGESVFYSDASGLSSNNGTVVITQSPAQGSDLIDCFLYSSCDSSQYQGWGTKTAYSRAQWVIENKGWVGNPVNSSNSTATRTMSRISGKEDSDSSSDWYITVTGGATFGSANTSASY